MLLLVWWISVFAELIVKISPKSSLPVNDLEAMAETIPRQIANAHTVFNVLLALIFLPITTRVAKFIDMLMPEKKVPVEEMLMTMFLDEKMIHTPALGLNLAKQEALRIGKITQDMVSDLILPFLVKQPHVLEDLQKKGILVTYLTYEVNQYLIKITREGIEENRADETFQIMYTIKEFEQIADICSRLAGRRAEAWIKGEFEFSREGKKELVDYHTRTQKQLSRAIEVFRDVNLEKAKRMKAKYKKYRSMSIELEKLHYERLLDDQRKPESAGDTHLELMARLRGITSHATNIARILLEWRSKEEL